MNYISIKKKSPSYLFPSWQSQERHHRSNKQEQFVILYFKTVESTLWTLQWRGVGCEGVIADEGQAGHQSVGAEQLYCAFVYLGFYLSLHSHYHYYHTLFQISNCSCLNPQVLPFSDSPPHSPRVMWEKMSKQLCGS